MRADSATMMDDKHKSDRGTGAEVKASARDQAQNPRAHRLKLALRENLKRRKSQAKGRSGMTGASAHGDETATDQSSGRKPSE
jgi:hypothetical protein